MPIKKASFKHERQTIQRTKKNQAIKRMLHRLIKDTDRAVRGGNAEKARAELARTIQALDKAAKSGTIKKNTAARRKSRLTKRVNALPK